MYLLTTYYLLLTTYYLLLTAYPQDITPACTAEIVHALQQVFVPPREYIVVQVYSPPYYLLLTPYSLLPTPQSLTLST